jgi:hypothetical protein
MPRQQSDRNDQQKQSDLHPHMAVRRFIFFQQIGRLFSGILSHCGPVFSF